MIVFITLITLILCFSSFYIGMRWVSRSAWAEAHRGIVFLALGLFIALQLLGPILYRTMPSGSNWAFILQWIVYTSLGLFACILFYALLNDLGLFLWKWISRAPKESENTLLLERRSFITVSALALGSAAVGFFQAVRGPRLYEVEIPVKNLAPELDGFRIAQISDLHVGPTIGRKYTENVVQLVNRLNVDLIALTGDFIDGSIEQLSSDIAPIRELQSTHGSYFVTGNHEYYWGALEWIDEFKKLGARVLINENHVIQHSKGNGSAPLVIAGVTDHSAGQFYEDHQSSPEKAIQGAPQDAFKVLLAHQPATYREANRVGFDLQLSGHTHGGQFFPFSLIVAAVHRFYRGLGRFENLWIYVNRGTGYWGPPIRFTVPSEVTLLKLRSVKG